MSLCMIYLPSLVNESCIFFVGVWSTPGKEEYTQLWRQGKFPSCPHTAALWHKRVPQCHCTSKLNNQLLLVVISFLLAGIWRAWFWCCAIRVSPFLVWYFWEIIDRPFYFRNPPPGIPSRQNIVDILLNVMVHDKSNAFSVSYTLIIVIHHIIKLKHFHVGCLYAITAIPGWVSLYVPGSAGSPVSNQHKGGWACLWSGKVGIAIEWVIYPLFTNYLWFGAYVFRFWTTSHMLKRMLLMKKGNRYAKNIMLLCCTT